MAQAGEIWHGHWVSYACTCILKTDIKCCLCINNHKHGGNTKRRNFNVYTICSQVFHKNKIKHKHYSKISKNRNPRDKKVSSDPCQQFVIDLLTKDSLKTAIIIIIIIILFAKTCYLSSKK